MLRSRHHEIMSPSAFRLSADAILVIHVGFVLFGLFGGLLAFRWQWIPWLHVPAAVVVPGISDNHPPNAGHHCAIERRILRNANVYKQLYGTP